MHGEQSQPECGGAGHYVQRVEPVAVCGLVSCSEWPIAVLFERTELLRFVLGARFCRQHSPTTGAVAFQWPCADRACLPDTWRQCTSPGVCRRCREGALPARLPESSRRTASVGLLQRPFAFHLPAEAVAGARGRLP